MSKYPGRVITDLAPAGYSVFFTGTSYLTVPAGTAFAPGTGNFTIEAWVYPTASGDRLIWTQTVSGTNYFVFQITTTTAGLTMTASGGGTFISGPANSLVQNAWNHIAAVRSSGTVTVYVNGVGGTPTSNTLDLSNTTYTPTIGTYTHSTAFNVFAGYMSNLRYVKGTALYTANFTPPTQLFNVTNTSFLSFNSPSIIDQGTANSGSGFPITVSGLSTVSTFTPFTPYVPYNPSLGASTPGVWTVDEAMQAAATRQWNMYDPNFQNTTLLLHGNPTNGTAWLTDVSTNNFALTTNGDAKPANLSPFSLTTYGTSGSGYFDGTGDYLSNTSAALISNTVSTFTVECWVYLTANPPANGNDISALCTLDGQPTGPTNFLSFGPKDNRRLYLFWFDGAVKSAAGNTAIALNTWTHIACVVNSNSIQFYVNGVAETMSGTTTLTNRSGSQGNFAIGSSSAGQITGYISNFRVTTTAVYTGAFTTPTAPLTAISGTRILTLQNSQSANNNAFLDSSSNNFLITRNGNTTQGSFTPFSSQPGAWSNFFGGSGNYAISNAAVLASNTTTFTIEGWIYPTTAALNGDPAVIGDMVPTVGTSYWSFGPISTGAIVFSWYDGGTKQAITTQTISLNTWTHIAVSVNANAISIYINGVRQTLTGTTTLTNRAGTTNTVAFAQWNGAFYLYTGYISNFSVLSGTAKYSTSFTPPTSPLATNTTNQVLLFAAGNRFADFNTATTAKTFTVTGSAASVQPFSPFYPTAAYTPQTIGGSAYFDGTGDFLSFPTNSVLVLGSGNFTAEAWVYPTAAVSSTQMVVGSWDGSTTLSWTLSVYATNAVLFEATSSGSYVSPLSFATANNALRPNSWNHIAVVRSGNAFTIYVNGVSSATATNSITIFNASNNTKIGSNTNSQAFLGYIAGTRIVVGTAVYTGTFTVPTSPFTPTMSANPYGGSNTGAATASALLNYTNAGVVDSTGKNALETVGDARISTAVSRFGGSSMFFDGTGDYLLARATEQLYFRTGEFTVECWVYFTSITAGNFQVVFATGNQSTGQLTLRLNNTAKMTCFGDGGGALFLTSTTTFVTNTWYHVAVARAGTTVRLFVNGVVEATELNNTYSFTGTGGITVGIDVANGYPMFGYVDDLRVTKGFARYTAAFTPQTSQWQDQ